MQRLELKVYAPWVVAIAIVLAAISVHQQGSGKLEKAFRDAWRDSFGTDATNDSAIALVLPTHRPFPDAADAEGFIERNGFTCARAELVKHRKLFVCRRHAWVLGDLFLPKRELWTLEFECDATLAHCTIVDYRATILNAPLFAP